MHIDPSITVAGLIVGFIVGLTGMGGGALMTPVLVLGFGVQPLAAISSDLVASMIMKPVGGLVHLRRGTAELPIVKWLMIGSVPAAFSGVFVLRLLGGSKQVQGRLLLALGAALLLSVAMIGVKAWLEARRRRASGGGDSPGEAWRLRPAPTVAVGAIGGLMVGMTSVGSGSLIIVMLMLLYPRLTGARLVGTDLVQAVPLVTSAAIAHILFGGFEVTLTAALLIGSIPGVYLGARLSSRAPDGVVRPILAWVLLATSLKLLGVDTVPLVWAMIATAVPLAALAWYGSTPVRSPSIEAARAGSESSR